MYIFIMFSDDLLKSNIFFAFENVFMFLNNNIWLCSANAIDRNVPFPVRLEQSLKAASFYRPNVRRRCSQTWFNTLTRLRLLCRYMVVVRHVKRYCQWDQDRLSYDHPPPLPGTFCFFFVLTRFCIDLFCRVYTAVRYHHMHYHIMTMHMALVIYYCVVMK